MAYLKYIIALVVIVIVVLCLYYLYGALKVSGQSISKQTDLNNLSTVPIVTADTSTTFTYSTWIYVNSYKPPTVNTQNIAGNAYYTIFCRSSTNNSNKADDLTNNTDLSLLLELDTTVPTLYLHLRDSLKQIYTITITDNMPIQKWTCVTFCVSNYYVDSYINGQLIQSNILKNNSGANITLMTPVTTATSTSTVGIYMGSQGAGNVGDIFLGNLTYWNYQLSPTEVSNYYLSGNPAQSSSNPF